ncbi:MAG: class I SAM-dependent methyltransferase, partial [Nitrososphaera sp.]|nr:class I SAM-dependent methyltransferase [Nitrososphaera sp.]
MRDTRQVLYQQYVSKFKTAGSSHDERRLREYWSWCRFKYLPMLQHLKPDDPILELGCGPGHVLEFLAKHGFQNIEGIDISPEQVELARARGLRAKAADVFRFLSTGKKSYAAVIAVDFVEHFTQQELLKLFPLVFKALRSGGILLLQTPNAQGLFPGQVIYGDLTHRTIFAQDSLQHILSLAGFH